MSTIHDKTITLKKTTFMILLVRNEKKNYLYGYMAMF